MKKIKENNMSTVNRKCVMFMVLWVYDLWTLFLQFKFSYSVLFVPKYVVTRIFIMFISWFIKKYLVFITNSTCTSTHDFRLLNIYVSTRGFLVQLKYINFFKHWFFLSQTDSVVSSACWNKNAFLFDIWIGIPRMY